MEEICEKILEKVKEHNERGETINLAKLVDLFGKTTTKTTLHKKLRQLVDDGKIVERMGTGSARKHLHISEPEDFELNINRSIAEMKDNIKMLLTFFGITSDVHENIRRSRRH